MSVRTVGTWLWRSLATLGIVFSAAVMAYAQSVADAARIAEAMAASAAHDPLLTVIKVMAYVVLGSLFLTAWLVRIIVSQAATNARAITDFSSRPCVLIGKNPQLVAKLLEDAR